MNGRLSYDQLRADVAALIGAPESAIVDDQPVVDQGLDSVRLMSLVERWRVRGLMVSFAALAARPTLREWKALLWESESGPATGSPDVCHPEGPAESGS